MDYIECIYVRKKGPIHNKDSVPRRACWKSRVHSIWRNMCGVNELSIGLNHHQNAKTDVLACKGSTWAAMSQTLNIKYDFLSASIVRQQ